jgi:hypothetical protein
MPRDPFEFDDYFIQDYVATVEKVEFVVSDYNNLQAIFTNRYDEPVEGSDGQLRTDRPEYYSIGSAEIWVPVDGGTAFAHASGDEDKRIKSNTGYGLLLRRASDLVGRDALLRRGDHSLMAAGLYSASLWTGLRFHWVTEGAGKTWENKKQGTSGVSKGHQLPVEDLPVDGDRSISITRQEFDVTALDLDGDTLSDLTTVAKGSTLGEFQSRGISLLRELTDDKVRGRLTSALSDTSFYETLRLS